MLLLHTDIQTLEHVICFFHTSTYQRIFLPIPRLVFIFLYRTVLFIDFEMSLIEGLVLSLSIVFFLFFFKVTKTVWANSSAVPPVLLTANLVKLGIIFFIYMYLYIVSLVVCLIGCRETSKVRGSLLASAAEGRHINTKLVTERAEWTVWCCSHPSNPWELLTHWTASVRLSGVGAWLCFGRVRHAGPRAWTAHLHSPCQA